MQPWHKGNGVIALGAHLGSFTLLGSRLAVEGYPFNVIINEGNFPKLWKSLDCLSEKGGPEIFPPKPAYNFRQKIFELSPSK